MSLWRDCCATVEFGAQTPKFLPGPTSGFSLTDELTYAGHCACFCNRSTTTSCSMQSAASIDRFRSPIAIRALNKFGAIFNGKVSRRLDPDDLIETAKRRTGLH